MTPSQSSERSNCHNAPVTVGGLGDFNDADRMVTQYYVCSECGNPCDLAQPEALQSSEIAEDISEEARRNLKKYVDDSLQSSEWLDGLIYDLIMLNKVRDASEVDTDEQAVKAKQAILAKLKEAQLEAEKRGEKRMADYVRHYFGKRIYLPGDRVGQYIVLDRTKSKTGRWYRLRVKCTQCGGVLFKITTKLKQPHLSCVSPDKNFAANLRSSDESN